MSTSWLLGVGFVLLAAGLVALEALLGARRGGWVLAAQAGAVAAFAALTAQLMSPAAAACFVAGWVLEQALSVDNLFVFLIIFRAMEVEASQQRRVLRWGILGAALMRSLMVAAGLVLLAKVTWALSIFGLLLVASGLHILLPRLGRKKADGPLPAAAAPPPASLAWLQRRLQVPADAPHDAFFCRRQGRLRPTKLLLALLGCELADVVFAVDSVPAVLSVVDVPILALAANLFAVLALRSLYGLLSDKVGKLRFLEPALALILVAIGAKMLAHDVLHVGPLVQVAAVVIFFALAVAASLRWPRPSNSSGGSLSP